MVVYVEGGEIAVGQGLELGWLFSIGIHVTAVEETTRTQALLAGVEFDLFAGHGEPGAGLWLRALIVFAVDGEVR